MASTNVMIEKVKGLVDTTDITPWENRFLKSIIERSEQGKRPDKLTEGQVSALESIHDKHFE